MPHSKQGIRTNTLFYTLFMSMNEKTKPTKSELGIFASASICDASTTIKNFFLTYSPAEAKDKLWFMMQSSFASSDADRWDACTRSNVLQFYLQLCTLIDASSSLNNQM